MSRITVTQLIGRKVKQAGEDNFFGVAQLACYTGSSMSNRQLVYNSDVIVSD